MAKSTGQRFGAVVANLIVYIKIAVNEKSKTKNRAKSRTVYVDARQRRVALQRFGQRSRSADAHVVDCCIAHVTAGRNLSPRPALTVQVNVGQRRVAVRERDGQRRGAFVSDPIGCGERAAWAIALRARRWRRPAPTFQVEFRHRLVDAERVGQRVGANVANSVVCEKKKTTLGPAKRQHVYKASDLRFKFSACSVALLLSALASATAPAESMALSARAPSVRRRTDRQTRAAALTAQIEHRHRRIARERGGQRRGAVVADFVI